MLESHVVKVVIDRPYGDVLAFLAEPRNFVRWGAEEPDGVMERIDERTFIVDLPRGRMAMRFAPPNPFGVLDYEVFPIGETSGPVTPVRLYANGEGSELLLTWFRRAGVADAQFASEAAWVESDLLRLKTLLENSEH